VSRVLCLSSVLYSAGGDVLGYQCIISRGGAEETDNRRKSCLDLCQVQKCPIMICVDCFMSSMTSVNTLATLLEAIFC